MLINFIGKHAIRRRLLRVRIAARSQQIDGKSRQKVTVFMAGGERVPEHVIHVPHIVQEVEGHTGYPLGQREGKRKHGGIMGRRNGGH